MNLNRADSSLKDAAFKAYNQVLAPYHGHGLKESAETGMESLPTRALLLCMINETGNSNVWCWLGKIFLSSSICF